MRALDFAPDGGLTASVGVAEFPECADGGESLREVADAALYDSKRAGRDRVACAPPTGEQNRAPALGVS